MISGIYKICNLINGKVYIGSSINIYARWNDHIFRLRNNIHENSHLQAAWNKYGEHSFYFDIVEFVEKNKLLSREQYWIDLYNTRYPHLLYNMLEIAGSPIGRFVSPETREKIRQSKLGKKRNFKLSEESRRKLSESNKGKKRSKEFCEKLSRINTGKTLSYTTKLKISFSTTGKNHYNYGKHLSKETRNKISATLLAKSPYNFDILKILDMREHGQTYKQIADYYGCDKTRIWQLVKQYK